MQSPYASRTLRFWSHVIDSLLLKTVAGAGSFLGAASAAVWAGDQVPSSEVTERLATTGWYFWLSAAALVNYVVLPAMTGASVGKQLTGIRIVKGDGSPLGWLEAGTRFVGYLVSGIPFYLGYLALFWSDRRQCWHDLMADTVVIHKKAVYPVSLRLPLSQAPLPGVTLDPPGSVRSIATPLTQVHSLPQPSPLRVLASEQEHEAAEQDPGSKAA